MSERVNCVDLIIPTYNSPQLLEHCLESLKQSSFTAFNLIVVDDASVKSVRNIVLTRFPEAKVVSNKTRTGLARVFNRGIAHGSAEYVVLLNDDTEVEPDWLQQLVQAAERHLQAGSLASKIRLMRDKRLFHSTGDSYSPTGLPVNRGVWLPDLGQYDEEGVVFSACAGAALYRRSALEAIRLPNGDIFDRRLHMYCEDVDVSWRLQRLGFECVYVPQAVVYHHLSATGGGKLASYYVSRNIWLVKKRSVPSEFITGFRLQMLRVHLARLIRHSLRIREPAARAAIRGTVAGLFLSVIDRTQVPALTPAEYDRIRHLLDQQIASPGRLRLGLPHQWN